MISEISEAGMTCVSGVTVEPGEDYTAVWSLRPDDSPLQVHCVVRHVSPNHTGVEFVNLGLTDRVRISAYIAARASRDQTEPADSPTTVAPKWKQRT